MAVKGLVDNLKKKKKPGRKQLICRKNRSQSGDVNRLNPLTVGFPRSPPPFSFHLFGPLEA